MASRDALVEITTMGTALLISLSLIGGAVQQFERGVATAEWFPQLSFGALIVMFLLIATVATRIGDDPETADGFTLAHWTTVVGLILTTAAGIAYLGLGFSRILSAGHVVTGAAGLLFMLREWRGRAAPDRSVTR